MSHKNRAEELVQQTRENHYLQFFLGFKSYRDEPPFDPSVLTKWRKRFTADILKDINLMIVNYQKEAKNKPPKDGGGNQAEQKDRRIPRKKKPGKCRKADHRCYLRAGRHQISDRSGTIE